MTGYQKLLNKIGKLVRGIRAEKEKKPMATLNPSAQARQDGLTVEHESGPTVAERCEGKE